MDELLVLPENLKTMLQKLVMENRQLRAENRKLNKKVVEMSLLYDMVQMLNENVENNNFHHSILKLALKVTNSEVGGIFLINPSTQNIFLKLVIGNLEQSIIKWLSNVPVDISKILIDGKVKELIYDDPFLKEFQKRDPLIKSVLFFPLTFSQKSIGLGFVLHRHDDLISHSEDYGENIKFLTILAQQASMISELNRLKFEHQSQQLYIKTISALTEAIDAKDVYTAGHSQRVAEISAAIAYELGLTQKEIDTIHYGALLHDIGKIGIPESILNKKGRLTEDEFFNIKRHPVIGTNILRSIDFLDDALHIVRFHHERYDGQGYPDGLGGENIPFMARIVCIADSWDAMTSNRSYRKALPVSVAVMELEKNKGTQFDPDIIKILQRGSFSQLKKI